MKIFKALFFVLLSLIGIFFAWSFGVTIGASSAIDDPELGKSAKKALEPLFPADSINKKKERRSKKYENYVTLNEVLRGRDEFYDDVETE